MVTNMFHHYLMLLKSQSWASSSWWWKIPCVHHVWWLGHLGPKCSSLLAVKWLLQKTARSAAASRYYTVVSVTSLEECTMARRSELQGGREDPKCIHIHTYIYISNLVTGGFNPTNVTKGAPPCMCIYIYIHDIWVNYSDLTVTSLEWWLVRTFIPFEHDIAFFQVRNFCNLI